MLGVNGALNQSLKCERPGRVFSNSGTRHFADQRRFELLIYSLHYDLCLYLNSLQAYDMNNDVFPIWGECLGLELISMLVAGRDLRVGQLDSGFFTDVDAKNISLTLNLPKG